MLYRHAVALLRAAMTLYGLHYAIVARHVYLLRLHTFTHICLMMAALLLFLRSSCCCYEMSGAPLRFAPAAAIALLIRYFRRFSRDDAALMHDSDARACGNTQRRFTFARYARMPRPTHARELYALAQEDALSTLSSVADIKRAAFDMLTARTS